MVFQQSTHTYSAIGMDSDQYHSIKGEIWSTDSKLNSVL